MSEVANILESYISKVKAVNYIEVILTKQTIHVYDVTPATYTEAVLRAREYLIGVNVALALVYMEMLGINEIYSFDKDFDKVKWVKRVHE